MSAPIPLPSSAPLVMVPATPVTVTPIEHMLASYMSPTWATGARGAFEWVVRSFGPSPPLQDPAYPSYLNHKAMVWKPFFRFVAESQCQDASGPVKLVELTRLLVTNGYMDTTFVTQTFLEAYCAYLPFKVSVNRLYGLGLMLQGEPLMDQVELPATHGDTPHSFLPVMPAQTPADF